MGIVRTVEWKLNCSTEDADTRFRTAFASLELNPQGPPGSINGVAKRSLVKNRWAATISVSVTPIVGGSVAVCSVDMLGSKHFKIIDELSDELGEEIFDDRGINDAIQRLGKASRLFGRKEVNHVRNLLYADELVYELGHGLYEGKHALVVLTSARLFFFEKSFGSDTIEQFTISAISSMSTNKKRKGETLLVHASGNKAEISLMMHGQADAITRAFNKAKGEVSTIKLDTAMANPNDVISQLQRLADLRDRGVLSTEEFESKKAELLGRI